MHADEQQRPDVLACRENWRIDMFKLDPEKLVFIDETWTKTNMTRLYGRAPRGKRLSDYAPHGHWQTSTFIAALRVDGLTAPFVLDGPINGASFLAYTQQLLAPTLRKGDIVIMDNLSSHKIKGVTQTIEAAGAKVIYLPPYSPDLNPIEHVFAKLKSLLRKNKERTMQGLWKRLGQLLNYFSADECSSYFRHCGYGLH